MILAKKINNTFLCIQKNRDVLNIRSYSGEESVILSVKGIKEVSVLDTKDAISGTSIIVSLSLSKDSNNKLK